ncbi:MAG: AbrB/MazE/SpoVT family DNA-binding domain-containing protein [Candidatus Binataceae bacterium]
MRAEITKLGPKYQVTIPKLVREALRLETGDLLEVRVAGRQVVLRPKILVDRDPELERDLAEAEADIKAGRVYGPFGAKDALKGLDAALKEERKRARLGGGGDAGKPKTNSRASRPALRARAHARTLHR